MSLSTSHSILPEGLARLTWNRDAVWLFNDPDPSRLQNAQTVRATKRRRIEEHAQSYIRGNQLSIASAALKGPFEHDWINPWLSNREKQVGRVPAAIKIPNTSARPARRQLKPAERDQDALSARKLEAKRRNWQVTDEQLTAQHESEPATARPGKKARQSTAYSRVSAAVVRDPFNRKNHEIRNRTGSDREDDGISSPLNPEDVTFAPDNANPYVHRWLKTSVAVPADGVIDSIWDPSQRSTLATPTNVRPNRTRRELRPQARPRLEPIEQIGEEVEPEVEGENEDEDPIISPSKSSNKKPIAGGGRRLQFTSPALNGSQGLQFRKGGRGWKEAIAAARFLELDVVDEISPNKRSFGSATKRPTSATKKPDAVEPPVRQDVRPFAETEAPDEAANEKMDPVQPLDDPYAGPADSGQSESGSEPESDSTESRSKSNASASAPTETSAPEPLPSTATLQPTTTVSAAPSRITSNAPPDHQPEDHSKDETTEVPSHSSQASTEDEDSDQDSTIMVYDSARKPDLSTQAAYNQAQEALDDIFVTPAASPEKIDETIIDAFPASNGEDKTAEPIAAHRKETVPASARMTAGKKRKVAMLDTPELERMANEVSFSTVKRRRTQATQAPSQPLKSLLKRSFPTPPPAHHDSPSKNHDSPCPPPPTTLPATSTAPSRRDSTATSSPTKNIVSTIPDHQPSLIDFDGDVHLDLDLDSCLKDAAGLLETADLETEVRGVRRSMGDGIDGITSQG